MDIYEYRGPDTERLRNESGKRLRKKSRLLVLLFLLSIWFAIYAVKLNGWQSGILAFSAGMATSLLPGSIYAYLTARKNYEDWSTAYWGTVHNTTPRNNL